MAPTEHTDSSTNGPGPMLYDVPRACEELSIGRVALYELINSGKLGSVRIGRRRLIPRSSLEAYVAKLITNAAA